MSKKRQKTAGPAGPAEPPAPPVPTARVVREYIDTHPAIKDCLKAGLINLSALARRIMDDTGVTSEEAALIACRRYELDPKAAVNEERIKRLLGRSKIEIRTKVCVITAKPGWQTLHQVEKAMSVMRAKSHATHVVQGTNGTTIIVDDHLRDEVVNVLGEDNVLKVQRDLVEMMVSSPETIEEIPGILAYVASSLAWNGINFVEVLSCYTDTIFVMEEEDMMKGFGILNRLVRS